MKALVIKFLILLFGLSTSLAQQKAVLTFAEAKQLADRGDARAQAIVAMHYQLGWQTEKDEALAGRYAQASAEAGHPLGIYRLGNLLVSGINGQKDPNTGYKLQAASVEKILQLGNPNGSNDPYAQLAYGVMAFQGKVMPQDKGIAVKAYHHAASQGLAPAIFNYIMASIEGQGVPKDKVAYYHFLIGASDGSGCECVVCKGYGNANVGSSVFLQDYPPAKKFITDNLEKAKSEIDKLEVSLGVTRLDEKYWKAKRNNETKILEPYNLSGLTSNWHHLMSIQTQTGVVDLEMRANYSGLTKTDRNESGETAQDGHDYSIIGDGTFTHWLVNTGLFSTIQYYVRKSEKGLKIESTAPLKFKNRMAICEYPIALEIKVTNNSKNPINLEQFGFFVEKSSPKTDTLPGLIFEEGENNEQNKIILHNFGWGMWNPDTEAKLTLWDTSMPLTDSALIKIDSTESISKKVTDLFKNADLLRQLNNHPDYATRKISLALPIADRSEQFIFEPNFSRKASDFYTKIKADAKLPSDRSNYRFMCEAKKQIEPGESFKFNTTFDFDKSVNCSLKPLVKINGSFNEGSNVQVEYDTYNYHYEPQQTFSIDGNGDASIALVQRGILGLGGGDEKIENKNLITTGQASLAENNTRALIQSSSSVMVPDNSDNEVTIYENILPDGRNKLVISAERQEASLLGHITIISKNRNQVVFRAPWSFDDVKASGGAFNLSVVAATNNQWVSWFIKDDNKGRLYCVFPGKNSTVYAPSSPNMPLQEKLGGDYKRVVNISSETENDIEALGTDLDGKGLVVKTKNENYIIPLASRLASLLQDSIKAEGLAVVSVESSDLADSLRVHLQIPINNFAGKQNIADIKKVTLPNESSQVNEVSGLLWLADDSIGVKKSDKWEIWSLTTGSIAKATEDENQKNDVLQSKQESPSKQLIEKINKTRNQSRGEDGQFFANNAYALESTESLFLINQEGQSARAGKVLRNALSIVIYDKKNLVPDYKNPKSYPNSISINPFGIGKQFAKKSEFFGQISLSPSGKMAVAASKSGNILYIIDLSKANNKGVSLGSVSSASMVPACIVRSSLSKDICTVVYNDGVYLSGDGSGSGATLSDGYNAMNVSQLEVKYNRPDIVLERLGASKEMVAEAKRLRARLGRRSDFKSLEGASLIDMPVVQLAKDARSTSAENAISLEYGATSNASPLKHLLVYNNGALVSTIPLMGKDGKPALDVEGSVQVNLAGGDNNIQLCAVSEEGVPSAFAEKIVTCTSAPKNSKCFIVACGLSEYKDSAFNLRYAAKDAGDIANEFKKNAEARGLDPSVLILKNSDVDLSTTSKIRDFLSSATSDDEVVLFFAGHGLLDKDLNYHYARYDTDFSAAENIGIQFEELESLVDGIKPLKRTILFDTCHSGEVEEESKAQVLAMVSGNSPLPEAANVQSTKIATRGMKVSGVEPKLSRNDFLQLEKLFPDSRRAKGANILTSSSGSEFSMESAEWNNGLFTYSLLKALKSPETDVNGDGNITFAEVEESVRKSVTQLSAGKQRPITRGVNREADVVLASFNTPKVQPNNGVESKASESSGPKSEDRKSWWPFGT
jgi:hypothetical protein